MGNNISILTDTAETLTLETVGNYGGAVFEHTTGDYAQHTEMQVYPTPYVASSTTTTAVDVVVNITVSIYRKWATKLITDAAGKKVNSLVFSSIYNTYKAPNIQFYIANSGHWFPYGFQYFGASLTGLISVPTDKSYGFILGSDDGSYLFIDGTRTVGNGGLHSYSQVEGHIFLTAGNHAFEVQFFEGKLDKSGVDLFLPTGVKYVHQTIVNQTQVTQNTIATQSLYLGLTNNGTVIPLALPVSATGTNVSATAAPIIVSQPENTVDAGVGATAQFHIFVISNTSVAYQWQRNAPVGAAGQQTLKAQATTVQASMKALAVTGYATPGASNKTKALTTIGNLVNGLPNNLTSTATLASLSSAQSLLPLVTDAAVGNQIQALVDAIRINVSVTTGTGKPFNDIPGQNSAVMVLTDVQSNDAALYRAVVSNQNGVVISNAGTLIVTAFKAAKKK